MPGKIKISNFGPVERVEIDLDNNFQIFIGEQASGKSTICKVVYFCQKIRDYTLDFLMDEGQFTQNHENEYFSNYMKYLTQKFMECFGKTLHMSYFVIEYEWEDKKIRISLNTDKYIRYRFNEVLKNCVWSLIREASDMFRYQLNSDEINSLMDNVTAVGVVRRRLNTQVCSIFESSDNIIYIPAGRSLLATLSEELNELSTTRMDLTMREFITLIRGTRNRFGTKIPEMVKNYTKTIKGQINNVAVDQAYDLIRKILKADYTSEADEERIYFDEQHWVKLMYGSSGQQEALWILMLAFVTILENRKSFIVIEEPEAHLFPEAQKEIVKLIALLVNVTGSKVILTTHSPYILTSANILLYSGKVEGRRIQGKDWIVEKSFRLSYEKFKAYSVQGSGRKTINSLMDDESHMIDTEYIDSVSEIINEELEALIEKEYEG